MTHGRFGRKFGQAYYNGAGGSLLATSGVTDVALGGHPYMIDRSSESALHHQTIPMVREQADQSDAPGEQSINPEGLWRRQGESWHLGAGQEEFDRPESSPYRFRSAKGVDNWTEWELSLLNDTTQQLSSVATNLHLAVAGSHLYYLDGNNIEFVTTLGGGATTVTSAHTNDPSSIATDGFNVWTAHGSEGVYHTTRGDASTTEQINMGTVDLIGRARARVIAASGAALYDITTQAYNPAPPAALPTAHWTHDNTDWVWTSIAESSTHIYVAGFSGDKSHIYSMTIDPDDGVTLSPPVVVASFEGETVQSLVGYVGQFMLIGTDLGFRFALATENGSLTIGLLIETPLPVLDFEGQHQFVWFGYGNFETDTTGLGRLSTGFLTDVENLVPAYNTDLFVDGQTNNVQSIITFQGKRVFSVEGAGIYFESDDLVSEGRIDTGLVTFGMTEFKVGVWLDTDFAGTEGSVETFVRVAGGTYVSLGTRSAPFNDQEPPLGLGEANSPAFEFRFVFTAGISTGLTLSSWLFRVQPRSDTSRVIFAAVLLADDITTHTGSPMAYDTYAELDFITDLWRKKQITTWQQGARAWSVFIEDYDLSIDRIMVQPGSQGFNGTLVLRMKAIS